MHVFLPASNIMPLKRYLNLPATITTLEQVKQFVPFMQGRELWLVTEGDYPREHDAADAAFMRYLLGLGPVRTIPVKPWVKVRAVRIGEDRVPSVLEEDFDWWTLPFDHAGKVRRFDEEHGFMDSRWGRTRPCAGPRAGRYSAFFMLNRLAP
jgi:hypothetical protein